MALTQTTVGDLLTVKIDPATGGAKAASISRIRIVKDGDTVVSTTYIDPAPVEPTGPWSLAGILSGVQAGTLAANVALTAERDAAKAEAATEKTAREQAVSAKQAEIDATKTELATLRAELKAIKNPPNLVRIGVLRRAIKALDIAKRWDTAVDATVAALTAAKADDPKRIVAWWESDTPAPIDTLGDDWKAIMKEIKLPAGMNEATILAKIAEVAATAGNAGA